VLSWARWSEARTHVICCVRSERSAPEFVCVLWAERAPEAPAGLYGRGREL